VVVREDVRVHTDVVRIRTARLDDIDFVRDLGAEAFAPFGTYGPLLPEWFVRPGVVTFVAEQSGRRAGFAMIAFYEVKQRWIGDVLAIAVSPSRRHAGIGGRLLDRLFEEAVEVAKTVPVESIELSVAEGNAPARRLFERKGFSVLNAKAGYYDGGQRTMRLTRALTSHEAR
jgi:ribosomal protein S18 acetylase RimI-like enzyme